jgi:ribosomal-protein-alanine N-acetyltransferase
MSTIALPHTFPFSDPTVPYRIDRMTVADLDQVTEIEQVAFSTPWPASAYRYELTQNELSTYLALKQRASRPSWLSTIGLRKKREDTILAYGGFWAIVDEAHISTIAVHPDWRGRGLGEMMLIGLIEASMLREATEVTLEVRVSNQVAQNLYRKYRFFEVGRRKRYYHDNNEDALIMTLSNIRGADFQTYYQALKASLRDTLSDNAASH